MEERVQKLMAQAGLGSRRANEVLIRAGRVRVNGRVAKLGDKADPNKDKVEVDGEPLPAVDQKIYIMLHKPRDVISDDDSTDNERRTARQMIDVTGHLYPVGRLDKQSMGLMLFTNDGELAHRLTHPRYGHEKVYRAKVEGVPSNSTLAEWRSGVKLEDGITAPAKVKVEKRDKDSTWLRITLREGRKRQIRRVAAALGHPVRHLGREQIGPLRLGDLPLGKWRHLTTQEVSALKRSTSQQSRHRKKSNRQRRPPKWRKR